VEQITINLFLVGSLYDESDHLKEFYSL